MTTIINKGEGDNSGTGMVVGIIVALVLVALFFIFGLPAIRGNQDSGAKINVEVPNPVNPAQ